MKFTTQQARRELAKSLKISRNSPLIKWARSVQNLKISNHCVIIKVGNAMATMYKSSFGACHIIIKKGGMCGYTYKTGVGGFTWRINNYRPISVSRNRVMRFIEYSNHYNTIVSVDAWSISGKKLFYNGTRKGKVPPRVVKK